MAPAVITSLPNAYRSNGFRNRLPLRRQHVDLTKLRDNLLGFVPFPAHQILFKGSNAILHGGSLLRGQPNLRDPREGCGRDVAGSGLMKTVCETIGVARSNVAERAAGHPQKRRGRPPLP
jgi:hypothetical protein